MVPDGIMMTATVASHFPLGAWRAGEERSTGQRAQHVGEHDLYAAYELAARACCVIRPTFSPATDKGTDELSHEE